MEQLWCLLRAHKLVTQPHPWLRSKLSLFNTVGSQMYLLAPPARLQIILAVVGYGLELDWVTPNFFHTSTRAHIFRWQQRPTATSPPSKVKVSCTKFLKQPQNHFHHKPHVKGLNISSTGADETVLTPSCKGLNSFHRFQSEGRIFYQDENPGRATHAATHQLFCSSIVCVVCR